MIVMAFVFIAILLAGVPVFIALAGASFIYTHFIAGMPDFVILHRMAGGIDSFPLLAVPFFILAGNLMNSAGITNRIYDFAVALAGWMRGGLAHVNIIGSVIFAGMSGTAIADAAMPLLLARSLICRRTSTGPPPMRTRVSPKKFGDTGACCHRPDGPSRYSTLNELRSGLSS